MIITRDRLTYHIPFNCTTTQRSFTIYNVIFTKTLCTVRMNAENRQKNDWESQRWRVWDSHIRYLLWSPRWYRSQSWRCRVTKIYGATWLQGYSSILGSSKTMKNQFRYKTSASIVGTEQDSDGSQPTPLLYKAACSRTLHREIQYSTCLTLAN